jgi:hypothetical protein
MFRKTLAAATTALVAAIFTFGAVAAPAMADDASDPAAPSVTTTDTGAAGADASSTTTPTPDAAPQAPADTTPAPADTTPAADPPPAPAASIGDASRIVSAPAAQTVTPEKQCLPSSAVSYTYDRISNSGAITIANPDSATYTDALCEGFYVTAAGWRFLNLEGESYMWPQGLIGYTQANGGDAIVNVGSYDFGFPVTCGQGDVYASYDKAKVAAPPSILDSPSNPYPEYFLQDLFRDQGPYPTSMWTGPNDHTGQYCQVIDSQKVAPKVTVIDKCGVGGKISWEDQPGKVTYALTKGNGVTGENEVTATAGTGWVFPDNTTTHVYAITLDSPADCGVTPGDPSVTPAVCTEQGTQGSGTIVVDQKTGILNYTVTYPDGHTEAVTAASISVPSGTYTVNVTPAAGYQIAGPISWPLQVTVGPATDCGELPTDAVLPTSVTSKGATCSTGTGSITVGPTSDYLEFVDYFIDGTKVTKPTTAVKAGTHVVTAAVNQTTAPGDTLDSSGPWTLTIDPASVACGQLKTLALTGTSPTAPLLAAGILLPAGAALLLGAALIRRRREQ